MVVNVWYLHPRSFCLGSSFSLSGWPSLQVAAWLFLSLFCIPEQIHSQFYRRSSLSCPLQSAEEFPCRGAVYDNDWSHVWTQFPESWSSEPHQLGTRITCEQRDNKNYNYSSYPKHISVCNILLWWCKVFNFGRIILLIISDLHPHSLRTLLLVCMKDEAAIKGTSNFKLL